MEAREQPIRVVMVGTDPAGMGGVATVITGYIEAGLADRVRLTQIVSHVEAARSTKVLAFLRGLARFATGCARSDWDLVHLHTSEGASFLRKSIFMSVARLFRLPVLMHFHTGRVEAMVVGGTWLPAWLVLAVLRRADRIAVLSSASAAVVASALVDDRISVIPNGVAIPASAVDVTEGPILCLGLVSREKGTLDLIEAFAASTAETLIVAGNGDIAEAGSVAEGLGVRDRVQLAGWVDRTGRDALIAEASIFALVSHSEGMPMALLEAMAAGLPVIVSSVGSMPSIVENGVSGVIVAAGDVGAVAAAIDRLASSPAERAAMGKAARARVSRDFSIGASVSRVLSVYSELA